MPGLTIAAGDLSSGETAFSYPNGTQGYTEKQNNFNMGLSPSLGWFVSDNLVAGVQLIFNFARQETWQVAENGNTYKKDNYRNLDFGAGGFSRYYFTNTGRLDPFAHVYFNAGSGSTNTDGFQYYTTYNLTYEGNSDSRFFYNAGLLAGITKMIAPGTGLEAFLGYAHSSNKFRTKTIVTTNENGSITRSEYEPHQRFSGNGLSFGIGIQVFLGRGAQ